MTAGERNCYEALKPLVESYGLDAALVATKELIRDARDNGSLDRDADHAMYHIARAREWVKRADLSQRKGGAA